MLRDHVRIVASIRVCCMKRNEDGSILLIALFSLSVIAVLASLTLRIMQSNLSMLAADEIPLRNEQLIQSTLAVLGARLPASDLAQNGRPISLKLPGGRIVVRIFAASGLINPNFIDLKEFSTLLSGLGVTSQKTRSLTLAMESERKYRRHNLYGNVYSAEKLLMGDIEIWNALKPYFTLVGEERFVIPIHAPPSLRIAQGVANAPNSDALSPDVDRLHGFYEIWLHVENTDMDSTDLEKRLWTHVSCFVGADHRMHVISIGWPEVMPEIRQEDM